MGPTASNNKIIDLARSLEDDGCSVHTFDTMPVEVTMTKFDMAVLVVTDNDPLSIESTDHRIQRILHAAGFLEARLAPDRVCLLVEDAVTELPAPPVTQIRYPTGRPEASKGELIKFIQSQFPRVRRDLHRQVPVREQAQSDELRMPWAMLIAVGLAALIPIVLLARTLTNDDSDDDTIEVSDDTETDVAGPETDESAVGSATAEADGSGQSNGAFDGASPQLGESQDGTAAAGSGQPQAAPADGSDGDNGGAGDNGGSGDQSTATTGGGNTATGGNGRDPSGPRLSLPDGNATTSSSTAPDQDSSGPSLSVGDGGGGTSTTVDDGTIRLPSTCVIDMRKDLTVPSSSDCSRGGRLVLEGFEGPWHNEISEIAIATGTTGTVFYEPGSGMTEQPIQSGNIQLNEPAAEFGVNTLSVTFSADGQHIHLYQEPDRGGASATLFFTLD